VSRLYLPALVLVAAWLGARLPLGDPAFLDLARGRAIAPTFEWSASSIQRLAAAEDEPGWLGSLALYRTHRAAAETGVRVLAGLLVAAGATLLYFCFPGAAGFLLVLTAVATLHRSLEISGDLIAWPLFAAAVWCLRGLPPPGLGRLLLLAPLLGVWPDLSGEAISGLGLLALALAVAVAAAATRQADAAYGSVWKLSLVTALALALSIASPGGLELVENPLRKAALLQKAELPLWQPVALEEDGGFLLLAALVGALAGFAVHLSPSLALAMVGLLCMSGFSRHYAPFFLAAAVPLSAPSLAALAEKASRAVPERLARLSPVLTLIAGSLYCLPAALRPPAPHPFQQAVQEIQRTRPAGPLFHVPEVGGLISWSEPAGLVPTTDLRPRSLRLFEARMQEGLTRVLEEHSVGLALVSRRFALAHAGDFRRFAPDLAPTYFDDQALIYLEGKRNPELQREKGLRLYDPLLPPEAYTDESLPAVTRELADYLESRPPFATGLVSLGALRRRAGDREQAIEIFEAARRLTPEDPLVLSALADLYLEKGMYRLAEQASRAALRQIEDAAGLHRLGLALSGQGRLAEAARSFERELDHFGEGTKALRARRALVRLYQQLGQEERAARERARAEALETAAVAAARTEADTRAGMLDFAGAARAYQEVLALRPEDPELLWQLALLQLTDERREEAGATLAQLLRAAPEHVEAHLVRGVLCARWLLCRPGEARALLERFLELAPNDLNAELARAELGELERSGRSRVK
jgi:tetratricopeptide (TPR) repeat protein